MAEPTEAMKKALTDTTSLFWDSTPTTALVKAIATSTNTNTGSKIGDIIAILIKAVTKAEEIEELIAQSMPDFNAKIGEMLVRWGLPKEDAENLTQYLKNINLGSPILDWILQTIAAVGVSLKCSTSIFQVADQAILRLINRKVGLQTGTFDDIYRHDLIKPGSPVYEKLIGDLGLDDTWRQALTVARQQIVNPGEIGELLRRGIIDKEIANAYLKSNSYIDVNHRNYLLQLTEQLEPVTVVLELLRREVLTKEQANGLIIKHGFSQNTIDDLIEANKPLLGISEIVPLLIKGYMTGNEAVDRLKKHGYTGTEIHHISKLGKQPLSENQLLRLRWHDFISDNEFISGLEKLGYEDIDAAKIRQILYQPAAPSDMVRFAVREVWSPDVAKKFRLYEEFPEQFAIQAKKVGIARETANEYWAAHWDLPAPGQGFDMFHRGIITYEELEVLLKALDVNPFWREKLIKLNDRLIPRRQLRQLIETNVETPLQVTERYIKLGYSVADANVLTRVDVAKLAEEQKDITKAEAIKGYVNGIIDEYELKSALTDLFYSNDAIDFYIAEAKRQKYLKDATENASPNDESGKEALALLTKDIITEYQNGMIPAIDAKEMLQVLGYYEETIEYFLAHADLTQLKDDLQYYAKNIKRMFDVDAIDSVEAKRQLTTKGYDVNAAVKMVQKWDFEKFADAAIESVKVSNPTKTEFKRWAKKGIVSIEEYAQYLTGLGYTEYNVINYLTELMWEIETNTEITGA